MGNNNTKFPTKKDMTYWILLIVILLTVVSVWKAEDSASLAGDLSLGGTLLSIFLAIIAIIFSFIQSSDANSNNEKVIDKITDLSDSLRYLEGLNNEKTAEVAIKISELNEIKALIDSLATDVIRLKEQPKEEQITADKLNEIVEKIKISQINSFPNVRPFQIRVFGKNALYNFLNSNYGKGEIVLLQTIRSDFNEMSQMEVSSDEMMSTLRLLERENKVHLMTDNSGTFITIK